MQDERRDEKSRADFGARAMEDIRWENFLLFRGRLVGDGATCVLGSSDDADGREGGASKL